MKYSILLAATLAVAALAPGAQAASYNFEFTYDGSAVSLNAGSTDPNGIGLNPGDDFNVQLGTTGGVWEVIAPFSLNFPLDFLIPESNDRTVNVTTNFLLGGSVVETIDEPGVVQSNIHAGPQNWTLTTGLQFDEVQVAYTLMSLSAAGTSTIDTSGGYFEDFSNPDRPFYNNPAISYDSAAVPLPAGLPLLAGALGGLALMRRRKQAA